MLPGALMIQNHQPVPAQLLSVAVEMPLILLLLLTSGAGRAGHLLLKFKPKP